MNQQLTLGQTLRDVGVAKLERHHHWLERAREFAVRYCKAYGSITSDDVHHVMEDPPHPNCYGALFRDKRFVPTGERVQTNRASGHAREIRVWRLA